MEEIKQGTWERTVQQHGNATDGFWTEQFWKCSECNYERRDVFIPKHKPNYCEECGSYMKGEKQNETN